MNVNEVIVMVYDILSMYVVSNVSILFEHAVKLLYLGILFLLVMIGQG